MADKPMERAARLCVVTAADIEFKTVAKLLRTPVYHATTGLPVLHGSCVQWDVDVLKSNIGAPDFSEQLQAHLLTERYTALLVIGLAGGLNPGLKTGDVVVYESCLDGSTPTASSREKSSSNDDLASISGDVKLTSQLFEVLHSHGLNCLRGIGLLAGRVIIEAQLKTALYQWTGATVVDMETYLVWSAAAASRTPCAALRIVLDEAASNLPDFNNGLDASGQIHVWRTLRALAASPRATWSFMRSLLPALSALERSTQIVFNHLASR